MFQHLAAQGFDKKVLEFNLGHPSDLGSWEAFTAMHKANALEDATRIYVVGKYTQLPDAYPLLLRHFTTLVFSLMQARWISAW